MITAEEIKRSLDRLIAAIAPPTQALGLESNNLPENLPGLPLDLLAYIDVYGSGFFENGGMFLTVLNPYEKDYWKKQNTDLDLVRQFKAQEGDGYVPYAVWPDQSGLLLWGYGENRKHFFWLTEGDPGAWPVIVMYDLEIFTRFDMPMLPFLEKLLCGDLDCGFIGGVDDPGNRVNPASLKFVPSILPS